MNKTRTRDRLKFLVSAPEKEQIVNNEYLTNTWRILDEYLPSIGRGEYLPRPNEYLIQTLEHLPRVDID